MEIMDTVTGYTQNNIRTTYLHALKATSFCKDLMIYPLYMVVKNLKLDCVLSRRECLCMSIMPMVLSDMKFSSHPIL